MKCKKKRCKKYRIFSSTFPCPHEIVSHEDELLNHQKPKLTEWEKDRLRNLHIEMFHEVPMQHDFGYFRNTKALTTEQRNEFKKLTMLKKGPYTELEDWHIQANWVSFCEQHNWEIENPYPFLFLKYDNNYVLSSENRKRFVQFLAKDLFNRPLNSVYQRFRTMFIPRKTSRYTKEEDEIIENKIQEVLIAGNYQTSQHFSELSRLLNRTRESVWRRFQILTGTNKKRPTYKKNRIQLERLMEMQPGNSDSDENMEEEPDFKEEENENNDSEEVPREKKVCRRK